MNNQFERIASIRSLAKLVASIAAIANVEAKLSVGCKVIDFTNFLHEEADFVLTDGASSGRSPYPRYWLASSMNDIGNAFNAIAVDMLNLKS